jgi:hypothetical protein
VIEDVLGEGAARADSVATPKLAEVQYKMGLVPRRNP